ncbi:MAG TPA: outer membrane lipoprotein-sorting protein [Chitinivibrionales bacterium]|jgi:outer membrane lipoprotein-sorting protein|nr:outer membrane lipoprotein-sorting protein [Chitinivibrionales bacterium]
MYKPILIASCLLISNYAFALTPAEILSAIDKNRDYGTISYNATMEIHVGGEVRTKTMKALGLGTEKALAEFTNAEDRGTKYLKINKELWIYFPSEQDVVKISGHMLKEGMMGSDVSYEDALESDALHKKYAASLTGEEDFEGHACYVLTLDATVKDAPYYKRKMWVDKELFIQRQEEMYAKSGTLLKVSHVLDIKKIGSRHFPVKVEMINKLRRDTKTVFEMNDIAFDVKVDNNVFSLQNLQR